MLDKYQKSKGLNIYHMPFLHSTNFSQIMLCLFPLIIVTCDLGLLYLVDTLLVLVCSTWLYRSSTGISKLTNPLNIETLVFTLDVACKIQKSIN